ARLVRSDHLPRQRTAVSQLDADVVGALDHVMIREDVAVVRHDHAGSESALLERPRSLRSPAATAFRWIAEEAAEEIILLVRLEISRCDLPFALDTNGHDGRRDGLDDVGVGVAPAGNGVSDG